MDSPQNDIESQRKSRLVKVLGAAFLFALIMGPGPGMYLINGYAKAGGSIFGLPALYAWCLFWFAIDVAIVLIAAKTLWKK